MVIVRRSTQWAFGSTPEPTEVQELVRWLRRQVRRAAIGRAWFLAGLSVIAALSAVTYWNGIPDVPQPPSPGLVIINSLFGLRFWSVLWAAGAVSGLVAAVMGWQAKLVVVGLAMLQFFWAICFLGGWIITTGDQGRGYLTAFLYGLLASFTAVLILFPADRRRRVN